MAMQKSAQKPAEKAKAVFEPLETQIGRWWANLPHYQRKEVSIFQKLLGFAGADTKSAPL